MASINDVLQVILPPRVIDYKLHKRNNNTRNYLHDIQSAFQALYDHLHRSEIGFKKRQKTSESSPKAITTKQFLTGIRRDVNMVFFKIIFYLFT